MLCGAPSFTFVAVCLRLYIPIFYTLTFYAPIFCSSLFSFVYLAPRLSFTSFFLFSILTPLFAYLIFYHSYYLTALPFCIILLSFLCFVAPLPSPLLPFVYTFLFPFLPFWRFWAFSYSFFLLNLFPFVTFFIFSFPFVPFYVPFSLFRLLFLSLFFFFPFPFLLFPPSSLSSFFLLPFFDAPFWSLFGAPLWPPGVQAHAMHPPRYATDWPQAFKAWFYVKAYKTIAVMLAVMI